MRAVCRGCMNRCSLEEGQTGMCRARKNTGGAVIPVNYGKITSMALDPRSLILKCFSNVFIASSFVFLLFKFKVKSK